MVIRKAGEEIPNAKLPIIPNGLPLVKIFINELFFYSTCYIFRNYFSYIYAFFYIYLQKV